MVVIGFLAAHRRVVERRGNHLGDPLVLELDPALLEVASLVSAKFDTLRARFGIYSFIRRGILRDKGTFLGQIYSANFAVMR